MLYFVDAYAWIEYFKGSAKGEKLRELLGTDGAELITLECTISELRGWSFRENADFSLIQSMVKANSHVYSVTFDEWFKAAEIKHFMRKTIKDFGLIDSILLAKQKKLDCKIVSGDPHFKKLPNVVYLK